MQLVALAITTLAHHYVICMTISYTLTKLLTSAFSVYIVHS